MFVDDITVARVILALKTRLNVEVATTAKKNCIELASKLIGARVLE